jgi:hypothetical protein
MSDLHCPSCGRDAIAEVASADAAVNVTDGYTVCDVRPHQHDETGFRHYIHDE